MLRLKLTVTCTLTVLQQILWLLPVAASDLPQADKVAAVEFLRLPAPAKGIFAVHPNEDFSGVLISGSSFYRFKRNGEYELLKRVGNPTSLVQFNTGRLVIVDAAQPGVFFTFRTPTTEGIRGRSITRGTEERPLQRPASLLQELRHIPQAGGAEATVSTGRIYLSDSGNDDKDLKSGVIFYITGSNPDRAQTRVAADGLASPQGMALSKDGNVLYVVEQKANRILAFPVTEPGKLGQPKVLVEFPVKDSDDPSTAGRPAGLCLDDAGRLYVALEGKGVIQVFDPTGRLLRSYDSGMRWPKAVAFIRTSDGERLYIAGRTKVGDQSKGIVTYLKLGVKGLNLTPDSF